MNENVASVYEAVADADGDYVALVQGERRIAWHALDDRAARLAGHLQAAGLKPGDRIVIALYNSIEYFETLLAAFKARVTPVNINYRASPKELRYFFERGEAGAIVYHQSLAAIVAEAADAMRSPRALIAVPDGSGAAPVPGSVDYMAAIAETPPAPRIPRSGDDQLIIFTGGTTGLPKPVLWKHSVLLTLLARNAGNATTFDQFGAAAVAG
ncbi:MAG: AMP-binding protein, partial [Stellaceae bacterium]